MISTLTHTQPRFSGIRFDDASFNEQYSEPSIPQHEITAALKRDEDLVSFLADQDVHLVVKVAKEHNSPDPLWFYVSFENGKQEPVLKCVHDIGRNIYAIGRGANFQTPLTNAVRELHRLQQCNIEALTGQVDKLTSGVAKTFTTLKAEFSEVLADLVRPMIRP